MTGQTITATITDRVDGEGNTAQQAFDAAAAKLTRIPDDYTVSMSKDSWGWWRCYIEWPTKLTATIGGQP